jgi:hypothetical protein
VPAWKFCRITLPLVWRNERAAQGRSFTSGHPYASAASSPIWPVVGPARFRHAARTRLGLLLTASSRSQVAMRTAGAAAYLTCELLSVSVCWCPSLAAGAVTHLVTRLAAFYRLRRPSIRMKITTITRMITTETIRIFHGLKSWSLYIMRRCSHTPPSFRAVPDQFWPDSAHLQCQENLTTRPRGLPCP